MSGTDLEERLRQIEEILAELVVLVCQLLMQQQALQRTDHHGLGRGGRREGEE